MSAQASIAFDGREPPRRLDRPPGRSVLVDRLVADLALGVLRSLAFVVPSDVSMTLPLYDVAIATARRGWEIGIEDVRYWFVTPEPEPVTVAAGQRLEPEGITFIGSTFADIRHGLVLLDPQGESIEVDLVVSLEHSGGFECTPGGVGSSHEPLTNRRSSESVRPVAVAASPWRAAPASERLGCGYGESCGRGRVSRGGDIEWGRGRDAGL